MDNTLAELEEKTFEEDDSAEVPPTDIVAYNELRSCADLFRMHEQGVLDVKPAFQRDVVWKGPEQTRFIDSLVKQLPIPSMCFAMDHRAQRWIVIDGLQRISTIVKFLEGGDWTLADLEDIDQGLAGSSVAAMKLPKDPLHHFYTRVENLSVPVTVLRCDFKKKTHMNYLFMIFHRLNTGGAKLNNQEIRNCIFGGTFNNLLKELDKNTTWRKLNAMKKDLSYRFTKQEVLLRFFAFHDQGDQYQGHLAKFLNSYMQDHKNADEAFIQQKRSLFERTISRISDKPFGQGTPSKIPVTILEALLVGVASNIDDLEALSASTVRSRAALLYAHPEFSEAALKEGLSKKPRVAARLSAAIAIMRGD